MAPAEDDDARHRREEAERRAKRKHAKTHRSEAQKEKERKRREHAQKVLQQHGGEKRQKVSSQPPPPEEAKSIFQELFSQRAQGFQIDFRFRNAPPRPPVGPCFVGNGLDGILLEASKYKPLNAVEMNYRWKLHSEPDLGVPLAPSAMDLKSYTPSETQSELHPDDVALLEWKGSLGDTDAQELKRRRDHARAVARLALAGKSPAKLAEKAKASQASSSSATTGKKAFSRVLDETMQSWMKKTTYLSNDYTRKVHDFKSLAKTKAQLAQDLEAKQIQIAKLRSPDAIAKAFEQQAVRVVHPTKKNLKLVAEIPLIPNIDHWGHTYTHSVMDKSPGFVDKLDRAFLANVQKKEANARMTCQLFTPTDDDNNNNNKDDEEEDNKNNNDSKSYQAIQQYDLDVIPLKEEEAPHINFSWWIDRDRNVARYIPISSRVQLSTGRPLHKKNYRMTVTRRTMTAEEIAEMDEIVAEVDIDAQGKKGGGSSSMTAATTRRTRIQDDSDSDDSDDHGESFAMPSRTIVADDD